MDTETESPQPERKDAEGWEERRRQFISQPSTVETRRLQAVCVRRACKTYGSKNDTNVILDSLNMTVPKGVIYGLLGASGCGKTTLLSCIVGRKYLDSGELWVVGGHPGTRGSGVPGPRVGYMPQNIALYGDFTVQETFTFFGWVNGVPEQDVAERMRFYLELLELPDMKRYVKNMSGGQQRRLSFGITFLAYPELVILDEPTAGVDPLVREKIWNYLVEYTQPGSKTVIVTTHYIDEMRQANMIGFMRGGKLLSEDAPSVILQQYNCDSLEDAFLRLVVSQTQVGRRKSIATDIIRQIRRATLGGEEDESENQDAIASNSGEDENGTGDFGDSTANSKPEKDTTPLPINMQLPADDFVTPKTFSEYFTLYQSQHMKALIWKNLLWMSRNVGILLYMLGIPILQICLFCEAIGGEPKDLKIAISNHELLDPYDCPITMGCNSSYLSCRFLQLLENMNFDVELYSSDEEAEESVREGDTWLMMTFPENYSESLLEWLHPVGIDSDDAILNASTVSIAVDMSNFPVGQSIGRQLEMSFNGFLQTLMEDCKINPKLGAIPIAINDPVFGVRNPDFTNYALPGMILTIVYAISVTLTTGIMLTERSGGIMERFLVSGITSVEILLSHMATLIFMMILQVAGVVLSAFLIYDKIINGSVILATLLITLVGFNGMCFGFTIACSTEDERIAMYLSLGSFLPSVVLSGAFWPVEALPDGLKQINYGLPLTNPTNAVRYILQKGWGLEEFDVCLGFITIILWTLAMFTATIAVLKFKKG